MYSQAYGTTTMAAAPAYANYATAAAPVTYAAAPQYAAAPSYAAPMVEYAAAPQVTYAQPAVTYAAQPQQVMYETVQPQQVMYETVQQPAYQYAAPTVMETVAAPQVTYVQQPAMTTQVPSYVAPPAFQQAMIPTPAMPAAPVKLTNGIPTPEQIGQQKAGYSAALDKQLKEAIETVQKETAIEKQMVQFNADKQIALYNMQVDEKLTEAMAMADEQATFALLELNKAKVERNLQLNSQAQGLVMDWNMKNVQTELAMKQYAFQMEYAKAEGALAQQYNQQVAKANTGTTYAAPAAAVR